jgi:predicted nucleotidyltransferase
VPVPAALDALRIDEQRALRSFAEFVRQRFGSRLRDLRLFGSRARGTGHEDSDLDVLVVVDDLGSAEAREIAHYTGDLLTLHDVLVSSLAMSTERWQTLRDLERLIVREIDRDGIAL